MQQVGALENQRFLAITQRDIFLVQAFDFFEQGLDPGFKSFQFALVLGVNRVAHASTIELPNLPVNEAFLAKPKLVLRFHFPRNNGLRVSVTTFVQLSQLLLRAEASSDAAECHGTLCGILSGGKPGLREQWLNHSVEDFHPSQGPVQECRQVLEHLLAKTQATLTSLEFSFSPLLPDDDMPLEARADAMSTWCQGFLYGFGLAEVGRLEELPYDVREVVEDFAEIARAGLSQGGDEEADEDAYAELIEYLRVGVQLVHDELNPSVAGFRAPPSLH